MPLFYNFLNISIILDFSVDQAIVDANWKDAEQTAWMHIRNKFLVLVVTKHRNTHTRFHTQSLVVEMMMGHTFMSNRSKGDRKCK